MLVFVKTAAQSCSPAGASQAGLAVGDPGLTPAPNLELETQNFRLLAPVGVVLYVDGVEHSGCGGMGLFVGVDGGGVLETLPDVVETFEQDFFAGRGDFEFEMQAVVVLDGLAWEVDGKGIAFFFFGALEQLVDLLLGEDGGKNAARRMA